jgi:hypothetical protein
MVVRHWAEARNFENSDLTFVKAMNAWSFRSATSQAIDEFMVQLNYTVNDERWNCEGELLIERRAQKYHWCQEYLKLLWDIRHRKLDVVWINNWMNFFPTLRQVHFCGASYPHEIFGRLTWKEKDDRWWRLETEMQKTKSWRHCQCPSLIRTEYETHICSWST